MPTYKVEIVTCSFRGDFDLCAMLCESLDLYMSDDFKHTIYVPHSDLDLFSKLATSKRKIISEDRLLPGWMLKLPLPSQAWRKRLFLPRRNIYLTPFTLPVRGWIVQQILKIAAALESDCEAVAFVDSDNVFIRPISIDNIRQGGKYRLFCYSENKVLPGHRQWLESGYHLLGLRHNIDVTESFISNFVVWRPEIVRDMTRIIEKETGRNWMIALAGTKHFAEYMLYGLFIKHVVGVERAGHYLTSENIVHSCWSRNLESEDGVAGFVEGLTAHHLAFHVQSTTAVSMALRRRLFDRMRRRADG